MILFPMFPAPFISSVSFELTFIPSAFLRSGPQVFGGTRLSTHGFKGALKAGWRVSRVRGASVQLSLPWRAARLLLSLGNLHCRGL